MQRPWSRLTLLQVFSLISLLGVLVIGFSLGQLVGQAIEDIATARARDELTDVVRSRHPFWLDQPAGNLLALHVSPADVSKWQALNVPVMPDYDWWHNEITTTFAGLPIYEIKIWSPNGQVIWSDRPNEIGQRHPEDADLAAALRGDVHAEFTDLGKLENQQVVASNAATPPPPLLELYVPLLARDSFDVIGAFEIYEETADLYDDIHTEQQMVWTGLAVGLAGLYLLLVGLVAGASNTIRSLEGLRELERYFSPAVARAIAAGGGRGGPGASRRGRNGTRISSRLLTSGDLTIIFIDIRDFTRTTEHLAPDLVVQLLDDYLGVVTRAVFSHGGSVDKFLGDGVLAVFGAPLPDALHALHAVQAVQQVFQDMVALNAARVLLQQPPIQIGGAIVSGPAITGNIGSAQQLSFTVIGDTVNLGARLVGLAAPGEVLVSRATVEQIPPGYSATAQAASWQVSAPHIVAVRGRDAPAEVYTMRFDTGTPPPATEALDVQAMVQRH